MAWDSRAVPVSGAADQMGGFLASALVRTGGLNEFFELVLPALAGAFGADRALLLDYREHPGRFDLIHFVGYPLQSRFDLQRRIREFETARALATKQPYFAGGVQTRLCLPLHFSTVLEALIVFESDAAIVLSAERLEIAALASKFIGLLMSSARLAINKEEVGGVDMNDLQRARQIQSTYLPAGSLETERYEVYGYNESSALVGGDYFDYFRHREKSIQCVLADASGHGLSAALIMSTFRAMLHADIDEWQDGTNLFSALNRKVHSGSAIVQYLTSVFLDFDETTGRLKYTNAGHFDPALIRADGRIERLAGGGPPIGMFGHSDYPSGEASVSSGDVIVLFTDGFTDQRDAGDDLFGEDRILNSIRKHRGLPLQDMAALILNEGVAFRVTPQLEDDLTLFLLRLR